MSKWDFKFHTSDSNFSGIGIVEAMDETEAEKEVRAAILSSRPDVTIKEVVIEPSVMR